jgi:hypothetical protein
VNASRPPRLRASWKRAGAVAFIVVAAALYVSLRGDIFASTKSPPDAEFRRRWVGPSCADSWTRASLTGDETGYLLTLRPNGTVPVRGVRLLLDQGNVTLSFADGVVVAENVTRFPAPAPGPVLAFTVRYSSDGVERDLSCAIRFAMVSADGETRTLSAGPP